MRYLLTAAACCLLVLYAGFAGCTSPTQAQIQPVGTSPATVQETPTPALSTVTTSEPISPLPQSQAVYLSLTKDRPTGKITLQCNGGPGMVAAQVIELRVTLADGTVVDKQLTNENGQIPSDATITVQGTLDGTDHGVVWVTSAGKVYKVIDQDLSSTNPYS